MSSVNCPSTVLLYDAQDAINNAKSFVNPPVNGNFECGGFGSCDGLYNSFANGDDVNMKINNASQSDLSAQIKYNIAQLAEGRIREMSKLNTSEFGTLEWFSDNIINYTNSIQLLVYILSLIIVFGIVVYSIIKNILAIGFDRKTLIIFGILSITIILCITVYIYIYTFNTNPSIMLPRNLTATDDEYIDYYKQQGIDADAVKYTRQTHFLFVYLGLFCIMVAAIVFILLSKYNPGSSLYTMILQILALGIFCYVVSTNLYYMILIPQLILMFVILQTIIQKFPQTPRKIMGILVALIVLGYALYQLFASNVGYTIEKCYTVAECDKIKNKYQNNIVFFIFFFLVSITFFIIGFTSDNHGWDMLFAPLFKSFV